MRITRYACVVFLAVSVIEAIVLLALFVKNTYANGVTVMVSNRSGADLTDFTIYYTGGSVTHHLVQAGDIRSWKINPAAESHLELSFVDDTGSHHHRIIGCYIERNYSGELRIEIDTHYDVHFIDEVVGPYQSLQQFCGLFPEG